VSNQPANHLSVSERKLVAQERDRRLKIMADLRIRMVLSAQEEIAFVDSGVVQDIQAIARQSGQLHQWKSRKCWEEIRTELLQWLSIDRMIVSSLNYVAAQSNWYSKHIDTLQQSWGDLYLFQGDGFSCYLVNYDSERGYESICWTMSPDFGAPQLSCP
jgi:hypothetical protein